MRHISAGSEIFVAYGKEYWDIIQENLGVKIRRRGVSQARGFARH
jgi:hypothetical protein